MLEVNGSNNLNAYIHYLNRVKMLSTIIYEWKNVPNEIPVSFIENQLFSMGKLAFINHPTYGFMVTNCNQSGKLNFYDEPVAYNCTATNFSYTVKADKCVIIHNNGNDLPTFNLVNNICKQIADVTRIIDVNLFQQKMPKIIKCDETQKLTIKNLIMKVEGNEPYILASKGLDLEGIEVFDTSAPYIADKLYEIKDKLWTELLNILGINNANTQKRERLITDEVNSNNQYLSLESDTLLYFRQQACEEINNKFNLNISCELRKNLNESDLDYQSE